MRYEGGGGCCFQGQGITLPVPQMPPERARVPVSLLSFEAHAPLLRWQSCPQEADEDSEAPEKERGWIKRESGTELPCPHSCPGVPSPTSHLSGPGHPGEHQRQGPSRLHL